jgi:hypothetical protein
VGEAAAEEARLVAAYLVREVEQAGRFRYGDVALLFRAMTHVAAYEDALRVAGVPFRTVGGRHYYDRSEVGWTIAALSAIEDPNHPVALVGALRSLLRGHGRCCWTSIWRGEFCYLRPLPVGADPALARAGPFSVRSIGTGTPPRRPPSSSGSWPAAKCWRPTRLEPKARRGW